MAIDIEAIDPSQPINNIYLNCTTLPTAAYKPHYLVKEAFAGEVTIENIQEKYDERFDDITYYFIGNSTLIGG